jgi:hypothetical protein
MSKDNIVSQEKLPGGRLRVVFAAADGHRTYEFGPKNAKEFLKGTEPSGLRGRLTHTKRVKEEED